MLALIKINKLEELTRYESKQKPNFFTGFKKWTKDVPLILVHQDGQVLTVDNWIYDETYGELTYDKRKGSWLPGPGFYDEGNFPIQKIYVVTSSIASKEYTYEELTNEKDISILSKSTA